jgi:NADP-dependent 3-hydroxy acid dehydrogenase YdfG
MASEQKVAVITGASGGIGAALVEAYRNLNYRVVATARSREPLSGDDVMVVPSDIADRKTAERAISAGMAQFGRIDTLVKSRRKKHAVFRTTLAARLSPQKSQLNRE